ncbi:MAG: FG-GAP-like repeat-containing protein [Minicystis sp.]
MSSDDLRAADISVAAGDLIAGKYRVEKQIGKGGMGVVISAMHVELEQRVAIKILHRAAAENPDFAARFGREARAAAKIKSEHVARVIDVGTLDNGLGYFVMEYLEGEDLAAVLQRRGALPVDEAVDYVLQACSAVAAAHHAGVVHRDIKPANLFLARQPDRTTILKVLDFGVSKITGAEHQAPSPSDGAVTHTGEVFGSPTYMSPEQLRATARVDTRADLWALGVVLYELLVNQTPFWRGAFAEILAAVMRDPAPPLRAALPDAPAGLEAVIARCLEKEPGKRYANVALLARALLPFGPDRAAADVERMERLLGAAEVTMDVISSPDVPSSNERRDPGSGRRAPAATSVPPPREEHSESLAGASRTARNGIPRRPGGQGPRLVMGVLLVAALAGGARALLHRELPVGPAPSAGPPLAPTDALPVASATITTATATPSPPPAPPDAAPAEVSITVGSAPAGTKVYREGALPRDGARDPPPPARHGGGAPALRRRRLRARGDGRRARRRSPPRGHALARARAAGDADAPAEALGSGALLMRLGLLRRAGAALAAVTAVALAAASCADLAPLRAGACGNFVVDDGEDCDSRAAAPGATCAAPGAAHACRYVCDPGTGATCPAGWGCGADGVCRKSAGTYAPLGDLVSFSALRTMATGDFDGDGVPDLLLLGQPDALGRAAARIVHPATASAPAAVEPIPKVLAAAAVGDVDADGLADVLFADVDGISLLRGRHDRSLDFASFPSLLFAAGTSLRAVPLDVLPDLPGHELVVMIDRGPQGVTLEHPADLSPAGKLTDLPGGEADLAGDLAWGRLDEASPCDAIVFPYEGAGEVLIFSPCRPKGTGWGWNEGGALRAVSLPEGAVVDRGVKLADLDLDGHLDLLVGASGHAFVAWGLGDGTFTSAPSGGVPDTAAQYALPAAAGGDTAFPLAVGDVNADGTVDFVVPAGVVVSTPSGHVPARVNLGAPWTVAEIADFNDNGRLDIAAASADAVDIDFLDNAGGGVFNASTLATDGLVERLSAGDFDGDFITDLAFVQALDHEGEDRDALTVAFGAPHGPPRDITVMGSNFGDVEQLSMGRVSGALGVDGLADVVVVSQPAETSTDAVFKLLGSTSRVMNAPLSLGGAGSPAFSIALAAGRFGERTDIAAVSVDPTSGALQLFRIDTDEQITSSEELKPASLLPDVFHPVNYGGPVTFQYGLSAAAANLQGDGTDELVLVAPHGDTDDGAALLVADYDPAARAFTPREAQPFAGPITTDSAVRLFDVDGDGYPDALVNTGEAGAPGDLVIFWNDGRGHLDVAAAQRLPIDGGAAAFACLAASRGCDLLVVSPSGASLATRAGRSFTVTKVPGLPGGRALAAADFDRDGTTDVALRVDGGLRIFRALPVRP